MLQSKALNGEVARNDGFQRRHQAYKRLLSQCSHSHAYGIGVDTYSDPIHTYRNAISTLPLGLESRYKDLRSFLSFFFLLGLRLIIKICQAEVDSHIIASSLAHCIHRSGPKLSYQLFTSRRFAQSQWSQPCAHHT